MVRNPRVPNTCKIPTGKGENKRNFAIALAEAGFTVLSLPPNKKKPPRGKGWQNWPPSDPQVVANQWDTPDSEQTKRNIGVATGRGFIVIDFDRKKRGCESYNRLTVLDESLPATFCVRTQGGGYHIYLLCDEPLTGGTDVLDHAGLPGIDLRATGNYVVAPGSTIDGNTYVALNSLPMAKAPRWLLTELKGRKAGTKAENREIAVVDLDTDVNIESVVTYLENDAPEAIEDAGGDDTTYKIACWVRDLGVSEDTALALMLDHWNDTKAAPPWRPDDLAVKVRNAFNFSQNQHGSKAAALAINEFPKLPDSIIAAIAAQAPPNLQPSRSSTTEKSDSREKPAIVIEPRQSVTEPNIPWLVDGLIPQNVIGSIYGEPGSYKSFVALHIADMVASNRPVFGRQTKAHSPDVIYIAAEGGAGLRKRLDASEKVHGVAPNSVGFIRKALDLRSSLTDCDNLLKAIEDQNWQPSLIIVDTLARSFGGGNENASEDMGAFINVVDYIREKTAATVLVVHHSGKDASRGGRGHSSFFAAIDFEFEAKKISSVPEIGPGVGGGRLRVTKQKDGVDGYEIDYALEKVMLGETDFEGDGSTPAKDARSSIAVREWREGEARVVELEEVKFTIAENKVLEMLLEASAKDGSNGRAKTGNLKRAAIAQGVVTEETWTAALKALKAAGACSTEDGAYLVVGEAFQVRTCENLEVGEVVQEAENKE